jgi:YidC/Oxa1 family membrane protein insertase
VSGSYLFAGLEDTFFAGVVLPDANTPMEFTTWADSFKVLKDDSDPTQVVGMAFGGTGAIKTTLFVGPKDLDVLRATNPKLEQIVDWGWFGIIAKPLFLWLHWTNDTLTNNWGWAIVLVTVIINLLMLPLKFSSLRSSSKMAAIQPQINAINEKYKNISLKDPRKQQQNQELMDLYQKSGINPLGGCIPLLLQMPFFIAFFKVLSVAIELRGAPWLWVSDLSQPEMSWFRLLPIAMLVTQVVMQRMTPTPGGDPSQKLMMQLMPVMLTAMFYGASSGLVLYWLTGNVVGIVQQYFFNKMGPQPAAAPAKASSQKKK